MNTTPIFDEMVKISKATAFDELAILYKELQSENVYLKARESNLQDRIIFLENLIKEYSEKMLSTSK